MADRRKETQAFEKAIGGRMRMLADLIINLSISGQPCDVTFFKRGASLDVKIDQAIGIALMYGAGVEKLGEMFDNIRLSDGRVVSIGEIWMVFPMPTKGISNDVLAGVDLADGEERWGQQGETIRQMIRDVYHCQSKEDEDRFLRRYLAS